MKTAAIALVVPLIASADAASNFRSLVARVASSEPAVADADVADVSDAGGRNLQSNCWTDQTPAQAWHPTYSAGWTNGYCRFTIDCNSPSYSSELACCKGAYGGQISGVCLSRLPSPPTTSPTGVGGLDIFYPDYNTAWTEAGCINEAPLPSGRPTYTTMLACCKGAYGGQVSGKCLSMLPNPPTTSPTISGGFADFWYPDYDTSWADAGCSNKLPLPFPRKSDRPSYTTQLACCKGAYAGQISGACLSQLPSPPTTSPTGANGLDVYYPDYDTAWSEAGCINDYPLPSGRPTYTTMLACCKGAYGGQISGACLAGLPSPPTTSPTGAGGLDVFYPDYDTTWSEAGCINDAPLPSGRPTYTSMLACCKGAYGGQTSGACLANLPSPPTTSPTGSGGLTVYYPDYSKAWPDGVCINDAPLPSGRPTYTSRAACCSAAYGGQTTATCQCDIDPCYSCRCGSDSFRTANGCTLTCS